MKNLINEKPTTALHGRTLTSVNFVADQDIKDKAILDVGCGYGWCELNFLSRGASQITASEYRIEDLQTIKNYILDTKVKFEVASAIDLPFADNSFDTVVCWEVLEHIPLHTEPKLFSEVMRVLRPGGTFYLSTPYKSILSVLFDPAYWLLGHRHYSKAQLSEFGVTQGFVLDTMFVKGRYWELFSIVDMYIMKWIFRSTPFYANFVKNKINKEHMVEGFIDIFVKYKKI